MKLGSGHGDDKVYVVLKANNKINKFFTTI